MYNNIIDCLNEYDEYPSIKSSSYLYNGRKVPRVTEILSKMIHEEGLMNWSNYLGLYKRTKLKDELNRACSIGTVSHDNIEYYINHSIVDKLNIQKSVNNRALIPIVNNVIESFKLWWEDISKNKIDIIGIENQLICKWYGGTYDLLISINGKIYLVDFKTSNHITYKYFLQLAAYRYILNAQDFKISGCIILQLDKNTPKFDEYYLNLDIPKYYNFMKMCTNTFLSLVYGYYNINTAEKEYNSIFKSKSSNN